MYITTLEKVWENKALSGLVIEDFPILQKGEYHSPELIESLLKNDITIAANIYCENILRKDHDSGDTSFNWEYYSDDRSGMIQGLSMVYDTVREIKRFGKFVGFHVSDTKPAAMECIMHMEQKGEIAPIILRYLNAGGSGSSNYNNEAFALEKTCNNIVDPVDSEMDYNEMIRTLTSQCRIAGSACMLVNTMRLEELENDLVVQMMINKGFLAYAVSYSFDLLWRLRFVSSRTNV